MEYLTKITAKKIGIQPRKGTKFPEGFNEARAVIFGIATGYDVGTGDYGNYCKFKGDFEATRYADGEVFRSARLLLPPIIANQLQSVIDSHKDDTANATVQFAVELGIKQADTSVGYEWTVKPVGKVSQETADPLAALRSEVSAALPAPAPAAADKPASMPAKRGRK